VLVVRGDEVGGVCVSGVMKWVPSDEGSSSGWVVGTMVPWCVYQWLFVLGLVYLFGT
jgi:hypothetical protein